MSQINENHTFYTVELRAPNGDIYTQLDLKPFIFHHPERDIAVLHLTEETEVLELIKGMNFEVLDTESYLPKENEVI